MICVFRLIDDLTGKVLKGKDFEFHMTPCEGMMMSKEDGYFVWTGNWQETLKVVICHPKYVPYEASIVCKELDKRNPIITIRLMPYGASLAQAYKITGSIEVPCEKVLLIPRPERSLLKYSQGGGNKEIHINRLLPMPLVGFNFIIWDELTAPLEVFEIEEYRMPHTFVINKSLEKQYKVNAEVIRVYQGMSDEEGKYTILLDDFYVFTSYYIIYRRDDQFIISLESR